MDARRYKSYTFISRVFDSDIFNPLERGVLRDAAEGLLLTSSPESPEIAELEQNVDAALAGMEATRRIHATTAAELRERVIDCGPGAQAGPAPVRSASLGTGSSGRYWSATGNTSSRPVSRSVRRT
jgi:hypothetical protein